MDDPRIDEFNKFIVSKNNDFTTYTFLPFHFIPAYTCAYITHTMDFGQQSRIFFNSRAE